MQTITGEPGSPDGQSPDGPPTIRVHRGSLTAQDTPPGQTVIEVADLRKEYHMGDTVVAALRGIALKVWPGEMVMVMGPSGSGKSTFMNLIGCLDRPSAGSYKLDGVEVSSLAGNALSDLRNMKIGV